MKNRSQLPTVDIVIPTLNAAKALEPCLRSIRFQKYDQKRIRILIIDGGSSDKTLNIAKNYRCLIFPNPLKTAEAAKAIGVKESKSEYIALIDSDNILPSPDWLSIMITPLENDLKIIGSEPWGYTYRPDGGFIERYSALTGVNDPYALIAGNYDRINLLRPNWNGLNIPVIDHRFYQSFSLKTDNQLPTIGANGTIYRKSFLQKYFNSDYLIDVDVLTQALSKTSHLSFAKVKCGIIHTYCESSISKFIRKQNRRAADLYIYQNLRPKKIVQSHLSGNIKFTLYIILIIPMLFDTIKGFIRKPDPAWYFHPLACVLTLYIYALVTIKYKLGILKPVNRRFWRQ